MARISKEAMAKREAFLSDLFQNEPTLTVGAANDTLKEHFGSKMSPLKVSALRKTVTGKSATRGRKPGQAKAANTPVGSGTGA